MSTKVKTETEDLIQFLNASPTAWHAVDEMRQRLTKAGFTYLEENEAWKLTKGGKYFVSRGGSSLAVFQLPKENPKSAFILGAHTDSPALKIKPNAEFLKENMLMIGVEIYGGPLITSWLNRDLGIAGRAVGLDQKGRVQTRLVRIEQFPLQIPQLAIHLDRSVNEQGVLLNKQEHLAALAALDIKPDKVTHKTHYLENLLKKECQFTSILSHELFLYPLEAPRFLGNEQQMLSSYRLDNLGGVHAALYSLLQPSKTSKENLKMAIFWDNEEIGSHTFKGASSPFLPQILERICLALELGREDYFQLIAKSQCLSIDLVHALHPNYPEKHEARHLTLMNQGIVIKTNAAQRYAGDAISVAQVVDICQKEKIPYQYFVSRNDITSGTTIGPITANLTGIPTVDVGFAQLSMHSTRELCACQDHVDMCRFLKAFINR